MINIRVVRLFCLFIILSSLAACAGPRKEESGSFISRSLGFTGQRGDVDADMLLVMAAHMAKGGGVVVLTDLIKSGEVAAGIYARSGNQKGIFTARILQAEALIELGRDQEAEVAVDRAAAAAHAAKCSSCTAEVHLRRSQVEAFRRDWPKATASLETAVAILEANSEFAQAARVRLVHSAVLSRSGDVDGAAAMASEAGRLAANAGDNKLIAQAHVQLGSLAAEQQDTVKAITHFDLANQKFAEADAKSEQVLTLCRIARLSNPLKDIDGVKLRLAQADAVTRAEQDAGNRVRQWLLIGEEYDRLGEHGEAIIRFAEAEKVYRDAGQPDGLATIELFHIGRALADKNFEEVNQRLPAARKYLAMKTSRADRKTPPVSLPMPQWKVAASLDVSEGALLVHRKLYHEALEPLTRVAERAERWNDAGLLATAQALRGDALLQLSRFDEAEGALQTASTAFRRDGKIDASKRIELALALLRARKSVSG